MRFFLDNDIDARCAPVLRDAGHECWTAAEVGLATDPDDALTVYAQNHDAVLLTHDKEFTRRRINNSIGVHVRLCCKEFEAPEFLRDRLADLLTEIGSRPNVTIEVRRDSCRSWSRWR